MEHATWYTNKTETIHGLFHGLVTDWHYCDDDDSITVFMLLGTIVTKQKKLFVNMITLTMTLLITSFITKDVGGK